MLRPAAGLLALAILTGGVSACALFDRKAPPPCPRANILSDAASLVAFRDGTGRDVVDVEFEAEISSIAARCDYIEKGGVIDMSVTVTIDVVRGSALPQGSERKLVYFVSVVDRLGQGILNKAEFEIPLKFPPGRSRLSTGENEQIAQRIPIKQGRSGTDYEVLIGFQLSQEQLDYNRRRRGL